MDFTLHLLFENFCREPQELAFNFKAFTARPQPPPPPPPPPTATPSNSSDHWTDSYTVQIGADLANAFSKWSVFILVKTKQIKIFLITPCTSFFCHGFHLTCKQQVSKFSRAGYWLHRFQKSPFSSVCHATGRFLKQFVFLRLQFLNNRSLKPASFPSVF